MASFADAPAGNVTAGEKIFKTKCAQCHTVAQGEGHKQVRAGSAAMLEARTSHLLPRRAAPPAAATDAFRAPAGPQPGRPVRQDLRHRG
jgi:mono/diheme cytochrome c family protein